MAARPRSLLPALLLPVALLVALRAVAAAPGTSAPPRPHGRFFGAEGGRLLASHAFSSFRGCEGAMRTGSRARLFHHQPQLYRSSRTWATFSDPGKRMKRVQPAPIDLNDKKDEDEEQEFIDPNEYRVQVKEGPTEGTQVIVPPKFNAHAAELPPGWEIIEDDETKTRLYYNSETGVASERPPVLQDDDKIAVKKAPAKEEVEEFSEERILSAQDAAEREREELKADRDELERTIMFKKDVLENLRRELEDLENKSKEITAKINKIARETPEERLAREKALEREMIEARNNITEKQYLQSLGIFGSETEDDKKRGLFSL